MPLYDVSFRVVGLDLLSTERSREAAVEAPSERTSAYRLRSSKATCQDCCRVRNVRFWTGNPESGHGLALPESSAFQDFHL